MSRKEFHSDQIYVPPSSYSSDHLLFDTRTPSSDQPTLVKKQFEQFQKLFLPIFLLTSSILFLVGIAIWFWLYKHKAFYALGRDELDERNRIVTRTASASVRHDPRRKKQRESINLTLEHPARRLSHPSTEVWSDAQSHACIELPCTACSVSKHYFHSEKENLFRKGTFLLYLQRIGYSRLSNLWLQERLWLRKCVTVQSRGSQAPL